MYTHAVQHTDWLVRMIFAIVGAIIAWIEPMQAVMYVVFAALVADTITAFMLNRRVAQRYRGMSHGKLQSKRLLGLLKTLIEIYVVILLSYAIDKYCFPMLDLNLAYIVAFVFCMIQLVSILENISSCNDAKWAKLLQMVLIDKTSRHLDYNVGDYIKEIAREKMNEDNNKTNKTTTKKSGNGTK